MAIAMAKAGGAGILHRFVSVHDRDYMLSNLRSAEIHPRIISVGLNVDADYINNVVLEFGIDAICVDVAHGDHGEVLRVVEQLRTRVAGGVDIIAGNVATGEGAMRLVEAGAHVVKVGIGPGSVCSTRVVSGHGFPQLSAIEEVKSALDLNGKFEIGVIADGGIRYPGDIVKALAAGADAVMLGSILAGTDEAPGARIVEQGLTYKTFRGMASLDTQTQKRPDRTPRVEGVSAKVPYKGPVGDTLANLEAGIRSGLSYSGVRNLSELRNRAEFVVVSTNTVKESHPHIHHPYQL